MHSKRPARRTRYSVIILRLAVVALSTALALTTGNSVRVTKSQAPPPPVVDWSDPKIYDNPDFRALRDRVQSGIATEEEQRDYGLLAPRIAPFEAMPPGAIEYARWQQDRFVENSVAQARSLIASPAEAVGAWQDYGPANVEGRVTAIALQTNTSIIYAAGEVGGIWKSTNTGATWTTSTSSDQLPDLAVTDLKFLPGSTSTLFAGGGTGHLYKTTDSGTTWTTVGILPDGGLVDRIQIDPQQTSTMYAVEQKFGGGTGVYKSTNGGASWTKVKSATAGGEHNDLTMNPATTSILYTMFENDGFYKTTNGGSSWTKLAGGLPTNFGRGAIAVAPSNPTTVYATADDRGTGAKGLYISTNSGTTWTKQSSPSHCCLGEIVVDPTNSSVLYFSEFGMLYKSLNSGVTLTDISSSQHHVDQQAFAIQPGSPSIIWAGNDGGIERSTNQGTTWTDLHGMRVTEFYDVAVAANNPSYITGGSQDNGIDAWQGSPDFSYIFTAGICGIGDVAAIVIDPTNPSKQYAKGSGSAGVGSSSDGGATWGCNMGWSGSGYPSAWKAPLVMSPRDIDHLYIATNQVVDRRWSALPYISDHVESGFENATSPLAIPSGATLRQWVYIPNGGVPDEIMLQFFATDGSGWEHRAYWGDNIINFGVDGTASRWRVGSIPSQRGQWVLLSVAASSVGLSGKSITGWASDVSQGQVYWDHTAVYSGSETVWVEDAIPPGATTFGYGSNVWTWVTTPKYSGTKSHYQSGSPGNWFGLNWPAYPNTVSAIGASNESSRRLYAGIDDGRFFYTSDRGSTWAQRTVPWGGKYVTSIAVDRSNDAVAYVTVGGVGGSHVWKTTNYGVSWTNVGSSLPDIAYWDVVISPLNSSRIVVVNDIGGVYESLNGGSSWVFAGDPNVLPNSPITSVALETGVDLTVGTYGRGVWRLAGSQP